MGGRGRRRDADGVADGVADDCGGRSSERGRKRGRVGRWERMRGAVKMREKERSGEMMGWMAGGFGGLKPTLAGLADGAGREE